MTNQENYLTIAKKLAQLGAIEYQYLYEDGKIRLRNSKQEIVAFGDCKAIMSFASTNNSYRWGLYPDTPTLQKPEWAEDMAFDITEEKTREVALKAALEDKSEFMFAGNWTTLTVYLACNNLEFANDNSNNESVPWYPIEGDMSIYADFMNSIINQIT